MYCQNNMNSGTESYNFLTNFMPTLCSLSAFQDEGKISANIRQLYFKFVKQNVTGDEAPKCAILSDGSFYAESVKINKNLFINGDDSDIFVKTDGTNQRAVSGEVVINTTDGAYTMKVVNGLIVKLTQNLT